MNHHLHLLPKVSEIKTLDLITLGLWIHGQLLSGLLAVEISRIIGLKESTVLKLARRAIDVLDRSEHIQSQYLSFRKEYQQ